MAFACTSNALNELNDNYMAENSLSKKLKLNPPKASYKTIPSKKKNNNKYTEINYEVIEPNTMNKNSIPKWIKISMYEINYNRKKDNKIKQFIAINLENNYNFDKNKENSDKKVIIYSHEDRKDIIKLLPFLIDLSIQSKCDLISYDYPGYGCSGHKTEEKFFNSICDNLMDFCLNFLKYKLDNILLIGKNIGAMNSLYISYNEKYQNCKGLILISPYLCDSLIRVENVKKIKCQTLLIKERDENDMDFEDNEIIALCREIKNEKEWRPKRKRNSRKNTLFTYNDFLVLHRRKFLKFLREYSNDQFEEKQIKEINKNKVKNEVNNKMEKEEKNEDKDEKEKKQINDNFIQDKIDT